MMGGFAMQWTKTSRPASGAEHQFSHLWDMQHHTHQGHVPSHGFKVAIGTLAVAHLYEHLMTLPLHELNIDRAVAAWPTPSAVQTSVRQLLGEGELADKARQEMAAKAIGETELRERLTHLREIWPQLRQRLRHHLPSASRLAEMLAAAGAPTRPEQIGIDLARLRQSFRQAYLIRRRFTVLDLAAQSGVLDQCLDHLFSSAGPWPIEER
jgi:glycerol-1-phosphate dehydrogenase [NAD(P)+]